MALLGWVQGADVGGSLGAGGDLSQPRFVHNESSRFGCRFTSVKIGDSPSIMFKGMEEVLLEFGRLMVKGEHTSLKVMFLIEF